MATGKLNRPDNGAPNRALSYACCKSWPEDVAIAETNRKAIMKAAWYEEPWARVISFVEDYIARPWTDLRGISNSSAAKSTIIIPLVGYWIVFNENIVHLLQLSRELGLTERQGQISPRVLWLYVALTAIAVGTFVYALRCPPQVKKYADEKDYINGDGPALSVPAMEEIEQEMDAEGVSAFPSSDKTVILALHFNYLNVSHTYSRMAVSILFAFGFGVLAFLSFKVFIRVFGLLITSL